MKKANSIIITTIMVAFIFSMVAFQSDSIEASNSILPSATPSPRKKGRIPAPTPSPFTKTVKAGKTTSFTSADGGSMSFERKRKTSPRKRKH